MHKYPLSQYAKVQFKHYRNKVTQLIKKSKKKFLDDFKAWTKIRSLIYNKNPSTPVCEMLVVNGIAILGENNIANRFNNFFSNHPSNSVSNISVSENVFNQFHSNETYSISHPFSSASCIEDEIDLIISNLSNSKSNDIYGLSNFFLKYHKAGLVKNLTRLVNDSLNTGVFYKSLKIGVISPIHKSKSKIELTNYRPITILPVFSKTLEYVMLRRMEEHIDINKLIFPNQFGFLKKTNTETAVIHILDKVNKSRDKSLPTTLTCLDLTRAFDLIQYPILLNKLRKLRFSVKFLNLFESYLTNRTQFTKINKTLSQIENVLCGIPQGGIISGLLFIIYINSINLLDLKSNIFLYCDDISIVTSASDTNQPKLFLEEDLCKIAKWLKFHYLIANEFKTKYLVFHNKKVHEDFVAMPLNIRFNEKIIERVEH